jgi:hypothetical protein
MGDGRWEWGDFGFWILDFATEITRRFPTHGFQSRQDFGFWIKNSPIPYPLFPIPYSLFPCLCNATFQPDWDDDKSDRNK